MEWQKELLSAGRTCLNSNDYSKTQTTFFDMGTKVHLAIFSEPYLSLILEGKKTIESRFSKNNIAPHQRIEKGDIVFLKESGGEVVAVVRVNEVIHTGGITSSILKQFQKLYSQEICSYASSDFWESRRGTKFATLFRMSDIQEISPFCIEKRDRRGWVTIGAYD